MENRTYYTPRQFEILKYVMENGGKDVEVSPKVVKQNKNFYQRIQRLENDGLITVIRNEGFSSLYTITEFGKNICGNYTLLKFPGVISPITK